MSALLHESSGTTGGNYAVRLSSRIQEASDHMRLLQNWHLRYEQLSSGKFEGALREAWINGIHLYQESLSQKVFQTGMACDGHICLGVFTALSGEARWFGESLTTDDVMYLGSQDELLLTTPHRSSLLVLSLPEHLFGCGDLERSLNRTYVRNPALANSLRRDILGALNHLVSRPLSYSSQRSRELFSLNIRNLVSDFICQSAQGGAPLAAGRAKDVVERARSFVDERRGEAVAIDEICQRTYTSRRTLQNCFEKITGESPASFLKAQRLNGVRRELLDPMNAKGIGDVAAEWGFWHLSQFSSDYKRLFGESPSATLHFARRYLNG